MKKIYEFTLPKEETVKETSTEKDKDGAEITVTKDVVKSVDKKFFIRRPTRRLYDDAELFYGVKLSEGIKAGLLTRALLAKRFSNDGGVLSDSEKDEFGELYKSIFDKQVELQSLQLKTREQRSRKENKQFEEISQWLSDARERVQEFESSQQSLYDQTAENRARNKTILWWVLNLAYEITDDEKEIAYFGDGDYEQKVTVYDRVEEEDDEWALGVVNKFFYYVSFWYVSKTSDPEQFGELIKFAEQADLGEDNSQYQVEFEEGREGEEEAYEEIKEPVAEAKEDIPEKKKRRRRRKTKQPAEKKNDTEAEAQKDEKAEAKNET
tara:strand:+ start:315 stop:1286 length:972 start_codon:yes stop_codon:yes gene_type:complete